MAADVDDLIPTGTASGIQTPAVNPNSPAAAIADNYSDRFEQEDQSKYAKGSSANKYQFIEHTYYGTGGYEDGTYVVPHPREGLYNTRRELTYYVNIFMPMINCMVAPVFAVDIARESPDDLFSGFMKNADRAGSKLQSLVEDVIYDARMKDIAFVIMDNFRTEEQVLAETKEDALKGRIYPYIYMKKAQDVASHSTDIAGKLTEIVFFDGFVPGDPDKNGNVPMEQAYKKWTLTGWRRYWIKKIDKSSPIEIELGTGVYDLKIDGERVVPIYAVLDFARTSNMKSMPDPSMYSVARLCLGLYNKESEVVNLELSQTFSILCTQGVGSKGMTVGPSNYIDSPAGAQMPGFISPDAQLLTGLVRNCDRLEEKIYKFAQQKGVIAVKSAPSGVSKEWDFRAEETVLKRTGAAAKNLELWIARMFGVYTRTAVAYEPKYPDKYDPMYKKNEIDTCLKAVDLVPPKPLLNWLWKRVALLIHGTDEEAKDTLIKELDNERLKGILDANNDLGGGGMSA